MDDFERGTKRIGMSQETQTYEMEQALQNNKEKKQTPPDCMKCHKHADGYILGVTDAKIIQCDTCIRKGLRDCMYHGYPEDTIPKSCSYKIGSAAINTVYDIPVMQDLQNEQIIRNDERKIWIGRLQYIENLLNAHWKTACSDNPPEIPAIIEKIQKFISKGV
jgi:hypothetical protein